MNISDFESLKKKIEESKTKKARLEGSLEEAMSRLKKEFGHDTVEEAEARLVELQKEIDADEMKLADILEKIDKAVWWEKL